MFLRRATLVLLVTAGIFCFGWYGCSDDTIVSRSGSGENSSEIDTYFPLSEGATRLFKVTQSNGLSQTVSIRVGKNINLKGVEVVEWISTSNGIVDTSFFRATNSSLFYYENKNSDPETILALPLNIGYSWERFNYQANDDIIIDSVIDDSVDPVHEDTTDQIIILNKNFPSSGAISMSVENIEQLQLKNGKHYSHAVKISNWDESGLKKNYYWYVPNLGLVKYVKGASSGNADDGYLLGELLDYTN